MQVSYEPHPCMPSVLTILCAGEPWRDVHVSIFGRRPALPERCQTIEDFSEQYSIYEYRQVKNYALRRLSMQAMLSTALARSLKERLISESVISRVVQELTSLGFLNDGDWSASFVRSQSNRKVGPRAIAQKLACKGIRGEALESALENSWDPEVQKASIMKLLHSRYSRKDLSDFKEKQKVIAALVRKGFELSVILESL